MAKPKTENKIEFLLDAWERFERPAGVVAKTLQQHRVRPKTKPEPPANPKRSKRKSQVK